MPATRPAGLAYARSTGCAVLVAPCLRRRGPAARTGSGCALLAVLALHDLPEQVSSGPRLSVTLGGLPPGLRPPLRGRYAGRQPASGTRPRARLQAIAWPPPAVGAKPGCRPAMRAGGWLRPHLAHRRPGRKRPGSSSVPRRLPQQACSLHRGFAPSSPAPGRLSLRSGLRPGPVCWLPHRRAGGPGQRPRCRRLCLRQRLPGFAP